MRVKIRSRSSSLILGSGLLLVGRVLLADPRITPHDSQNQQQLFRNSVFRIRYSPHSGFLLVPAAAPSGPADINQVFLRVFDATNNALRINGTLSPGGAHTPGDANQVSVSVFDPTNNALRVNCVLGCGGGGGGGAPGGSSTAVQFNNSSAFGGDATNFFYNPTTHVLSVTGGYSGLLAGNVPAGSSCSANQFATGINAGLAPACSQPSSSNLSDGSSLVKNSAANTYIAGAKQTHQNSATTAGFNLSSSADPSTLAQGDVWLNTDDLKFRGSAATQTVERQANKDAAGGYAGLDASGKLTGTQIPYGTSANTAAQGNDSRITAAEQTANKGAAGGYAGLDAGAKIPLSVTPLTTSQDLLYQNGSALARLPISTVTSGQCLGNNSGTWGSFACGGGGAPGGSSTQVQFNNNNALGGSPNLTWSSPALNIGTNAGATGQLLLANGGTGGASVAIQNNGATSAYNFNLPVSAGTSGQCLQSGGGGSAPNTWGNCGGGGAPGGSNMAVQYRTSGGTFGGDNNFTTDGNGNITAVSFTATGPGAGYTRWTSGAPPSGAAGTVTVGANPNGQLYVEQGAGSAVLVPLVGTDLSVPGSDSTAAQVVGLHLANEGQLGNQPVSAIAPNDTTTGTTQYQLAKINSSGNAINCGTGDTNDLCYPVISATATGGNARLVKEGTATVKADASGYNKGDFVGPSSSTGGTAHDYGATISAIPANTCITGIALTQAAANGNATVLVNPFCVSGGGGGSGYSQMQNSGSNLTQRTVLNFINGLQAADNGGQSRTDVSPVFGTTANTIAQGNDSRITGAEQTANKGAANGYAGLDASATLPLSVTPLTTSQDILYQDGSSLARLPISTVANGQCLGNNSGVWGSFACSGGSGGGAVTSVFGRTGAVVAAANDYTLDQIGNLGASATNTFSGTSTWTLASGVTGPGSGVTITNTNTTTGASMALRVSTAGAGGTGQIPLIVNEGVSAGDIAQFQVGGTNKFQIGNGGSVTMQGNINMGGAGPSIYAASATQVLTVKGADATTVLTGGVVLRGGNITGGSTASLTAEPATAQGGDNASTGTGNSGGNMTVRGGNYTGGAASGTGGDVSIFGGSSNATSPTYGLYQAGAYFNKTGTITAGGDIVCATGDMQVSDCSTTPNIAVVGVALGTTAPIQVVMGGEALINTDGTAAVGNQVCLSTTASGKGLAQAGACTAGQGIGTVISITSQGASGTKPLVAIHRY